ncbi:hypothetical protein [Aquincola tertiaricarbonis]|nr:hypothetical protein [Aquincola tertiaricarbonis]
MTHHDDLQWMAFHRRVRDLVITAAQALGAVGLALLGLWWSM